jgi:hypothetical protein
MTQGSPELAHTRAVPCRRVAIGAPCQVITPLLLEKVYGVRAQVATGDQGAPLYVVVDGSAQQSPAQGQGAEITYATPVK